MWFKSILTIPAVAAISFCFIGGATPAYADLGDQIVKLEPVDGTASDHFGQSVGISRITGSEIAIVGAWNDDDNGPASGSAYLFDAYTGAQIFKLLPNDGVTPGLFGNSVAISGSIAIVGAPGDDDNGFLSGSAYLFDLSDPKNPVEIVKLLPTDGTSGDFFGWSVAISGTIAIVGAQADGDYSGSAYLFDSYSGKQLAKLLPDDSSIGDEFGFSVGISGSIAIVGSRRNDDNGADSGSAYLFDTTTGKQILKLLPNDGAAEDQFGYRVAICGTTAIIGAFWDDDNGDKSGSAYLFDSSSGKQLAKLLPDDGSVDDRFGFSVAIRGTIALVGAYHDNDNGIDSGSAYLFDLSDARNPVEIAKFLPDNGGVDEGFGFAVAISGGITIVGSRGADQSGSAYIFDATYTPPCPWDMHGDGFVGYGDLLILLGWWCCDPNGPPDFDGDGVVNTIDLLELFANWGPCP